MSLYDRYGSTYGIARMGLFLDRESLPSSILFLYRAVHSSFQITFYLKLKFMLYQIFRYKQQLPEVANFLGCWLQLPGFCVMYIAHTSIRAGNKPILQDTRETPLRRKLKACSQAWHTGRFLVACRNTHKVRVGR